MNLSAKLRKLCALTMTFGAFTAMNVSAEETITLDTMVVTASGYEQKITDAPASISVITREELDRKPYLTILDVVKDIEGVDIGETLDKNGQGTISIRGMGSDYTLIMIDGKRQNNVGDIYPNSFGGAQFGHLPPLDMIERVEVIRGPMSTLYGADAMGGVVNIITKKIADYWTGSATFSRTFQEDSSYGNDSTSSFSIMGPLIDGKLGFSLYGSVYERDESVPQLSSFKYPDGTVEDRATSFGGWGSVPESRNWDIGTRLTFTPNKSNTFKLEYDTSNQKYDNSEAQAGTVDTYDTIYRNSRVGYRKNLEMKRDQWSIAHNGEYDLGKTELRLTYIKSENEGRSMPLSAGERKFVNDMKAKYGNNINGFLSGASQDELDEFYALLPRDDRTLETRQYTFDAKYEVGISNHYLVIGGQYIDAKMEDGVFGLKKGGYHSGATQDHRQWSLFAEDSWKVLSFLTVTGGLRYDKHNEFGGHLSPRLYAVADITDEWTVKGGVSTGYKAPKANDLHSGITGFGGQGTSPWVGNPDLKPEESINSEIALYYDSNSGHGFNITGFHNKFKDKISSGEKIGADFGEGWDDLGYTTYNVKENLDEATIKGIEIAGKLKLPFGLALKANYTYTDSEVTKGAKKGEPLTDTSKNMANATLDWYAHPDFMMYFSSEYRGKRFRGVDANTKEKEYYKEYTVFNLGGALNLSEFVTLHARVNNLFDKDFSGYSTKFSQDANGNWSATHKNDYNLIHKKRSYWVSLNAKF